LSESFANVANTSRCTGVDKAFEPCEAILSHRTWDLPPTVFYVWSLWTHVVAIPLEAGTLALGSANCGPQVLASRTSCFTPLCTKLCMSTSSVTKTLSPMNPWRDARPTLSAACLAGSCSPLVLALASCPSAQPLKYNPEKATQHMVAFDTHSYLNISQADLGAYVLTPTNAFDTHTVVHEAASHAKQGGLGYDRPARCPSFFDHTNERTATKTLSIPVIEGRET
jgi:hypothetical protein